MCLEDITRHIGDGVKAFGDAGVSDNDIEMREEVRRRLQQLDNIAGGRGGGCVVGDEGKGAGGSFGELEKGLAGWMGGVTHGCDHKGVGVEEIVRDQATADS